VVKLSSLGDVVHALPAVHALRVGWPQCELTWVVERREQALLAGNPDLDHVVPVDTRLWRREFRRLAGSHAVFVKLRGLVRRLRRGRFDVAIDLQGLWKSGAITWLTRAPVRVGLAGRQCRERGSARFTNRHVPLPPEAVHVVDQHLAVVAALGVGQAATRERAFPIVLDATAVARMARYLEGEGVKADPLVTLLPGSAGAAKRWPVTAFARLGDELALRLGARVLVCWGPGEETLALAVAGGMRAPALVPPATTIPDLAALLARSTLAIGGDTGPLHVAAALGVPAVGLYGPTQASRNGPLGPRSTALQSPTGRLDDIAVEAVVAAAEAVCR
jgi:lipopolysaccharide heptosyltransferase I